MRRIFGGGPTPSNVPSPEFVAPVFFFPERVVVLCGQRGKRLLQLGALTGGTTKGGFWAQLEQLGGTEGGESRSSGE